MKGIKKMRQYSAYDSGSKEQQPQVECEIGERLTSKGSGEVDAYVQEHQRSDPEGQAVQFEERIMFPWSKIC